MILGQTQPFASPVEALKHISEKPWSDYTKADYTIEQWHAACLVHTHEEAPTSKSECKLPVKTPNGALNRNGVHAAAAALAGARGGLKGVSDDQKKKAASALKRYYAQLDEDPPESLAEHGVEFVGDILKHYGVKGMRWGVRKDRESGQDLVGNLSTGGLQYGHSNIDLRDTKQLTFDSSKGYVDVRPKNGFTNASVAERHAELIKSLEEMRERYPAVKAMTIDVVPMSHVPRMAGATESSFACVQSMDPGQARIMYNDVKGKLSPYEASYVKDFMPGMGTKGYLGNHEMGHLLASINGTMPHTVDLMKKGYRPRDIRRWTKQKHKRHKKLLKKHGLSYKEVRKISKYAATEPSEALAELSGHYFTPGLRSTLSPDTQRKAEALFNDLGGVR